MSGMTSRERVLRAIAHKEPDRVPINFGGEHDSGIVECRPNGRIYTRLCQHLGFYDRPEPVIADCLNIVVNIDERVQKKFGADIRVIGPNLKPATVHEDGTKTWESFCGVRIRRLGYYDEFFDFPMRNMTSVKDIKNYPFWPDPKNPLITKGKREDAKKAFIKILDLSPDHAQAKEELKLLKLQPFHIEKVNPMFDDFEDGDLFSNWQTKWMEMTDKYIGGSSTSKIQIMDEGAENSKKYLKITGKVTTQVAYGFAGIYIILDPDSFDPSTGNPVDITRFQGIKFWVKGSKNQYRINFITSSVKDYDYFMSVFSTSEDWKSIKIPFKELRQFGFGVPAKWTGKDVQGILVLTLTSPAIGLDSFELDIDNICFY